MTDTTLPADAEHTTPGRRLSPRDESRLSYASTTYLLATKALAQVPVVPDPAPGDLLRSALDLLRRAEQVVESAVVAERERGTTWEQIGAAAGTTRQAAHERWYDDVRIWSVTGRSELPQNSPKDSLQVAAELDSLFGTLVPERTDAVTSGLDAIRFPGSQEYEASLRARATALRSRLDVLRKRSSELAGEKSRAATAGDSAAVATAAESKAACDQEISDLYRQLVSVEPSLAEEHLHEAKGH
ncbi:hypothetical protein [Streptomyces sp. NPDC088915]|uniref:hypothetical protein n=1 Tax=Streptomyces sp. NPDC088915 TaxID=3365912 RepID=UPI00382B5C07